MSCAVIYSTMTGHSKKLANSVADALGVSANNIKENKEIKTDVLFLVFGIYSGVISPEMQKLISEISFKNAKNVCLIMSSCTQNYSKVTVKEILKDRGINVLDEQFSCAGGFLIMKMGHPNRREILDAANFAKSIATKYIQNK